MVIQSAEFVSSVFKNEQIPTPYLEEVAFFGRSNVGKSTLINCITGKKIARTSSTPGKTQCLNYYLINKAFYFVDAPGYGFAKVPVSLKKSWDRMIKSWLEEHRQVRLVVQIIDARHEIQKNDRIILEWLSQYDIPIVVVANKVDKLKSNERQRTLKQLGEDAVYKLTNLIPMSATTGEGKPVFLAALSKILETRS
ncbi:MAG: YihA family ribosome biogenesis GTP-binding protein [Bacteroidetes bacterium]|nr:YihA family ribosome biogenesis GTP-binding protein [Bacteroidota bacterium]